MVRWSEGRWKTSWWKSVEERVYTREEWKKLPRTVRNRRILHMPMELMSYVNKYFINNYQLHWQYYLLFLLLLHSVSEWHLAALSCIWTKVTCVCVCVCVCVHRPRNTKDAVWRRSIKLCLSSTDHKEAHCSKKMNWHDTQKKPTAAGHCKTWFC